mgnify:CR=1 FL=1
MRSPVPLVALVGRPNVGKSTLFNRITSSRRAIVAPVAGTTRDVQLMTTSWCGRSFQLGDTGGLHGASEDPLQEMVSRHGRHGIATADVLVFVVDGREGVVPGDLVIGQELRKEGKPVVLAVNKTDDKRGRAGVADFYQLGFEPVVGISAEHGDGVGDLLDAVVDQLPAAGPKDRSPDSMGEPEGPDPGGQAPELAIALIGRPNVGKSSLLNRLLRQERVLVSEVPGTTRDAIAAPLMWHQRRFLLVDTAGMRRPGRTRGGGMVELVSVAGAKKAIASSDVVALLIDAVEGATDQDAAIGGEADRAGRGIVIVVNKWDLVKRADSNFAKTFDESLRHKMRFLDYAPIVHLSALTGERTPKLLEVIDRVAGARRQRVPTPALNRLVESITRANPPVSPERRHVRILYAAQVGVAPPRFVFFTNVATTFHFSYERFLINQLRAHFGFEGTTLRLEVRRRAR